MRRLIAGFALLGVFSAVCVADAANKLFNGNFDLTPGSAYYQIGCCEGTEDDVPGWLMFLNNAPVDDGSWVLVSPEAGQGHDLDMAPGPLGGGIMTAAASRVPVFPGNTYTASLTYDNYFTPAGAAYFIDWFESDGDPISSTGGPLADPNGPFGYDPYGQKLSIVAAAPAGAGLAGVRFTSGNPGYSGLAADNFSFVPEPCTAILAALAVCGLAASRRRRG
jgi:MYXO-CTERM domain-containing protein